MLPWSPSVDANEAPGLGHGGPGRPAQEGHSVSSGRDWRFVTADLKNEGLYSGSSARHRLEGTRIKMESRCVAA